MQWNYAMLHAQKTYLNNIKSKLLVKFSGG